MNADTGSLSVAVVCDPSGPDAADVHGYLQARNLTQAAWFAPRDVDEVEKGLRSGRVRRVVFPRLADFLEPLWDEALHVEFWQASGVMVDFVEPGGASTVAAIVDRWEKTRRRRRRRQVVAGLILSIAAMAAAFVIIALGR